MTELYKIADQLIAELKRMEKSGTPKRTVLGYKFTILDYIEQQYR